jgi:hypothetical protein
MFFLLLHFYFCKIKLFLKNLCAVKFLQSFVLTYIYIDLSIYFFTGLNSGVPAKIGGKKKRAAPAAPLCHVSAREHEVATRPWQQHAPCSALLTPDRDGCSRPQLHASPGLAQHGVA